MSLPCSVSSKAFQLYLKYHAKFWWLTRVSMIWPSSTSSDPIFYYSDLSFLCSGHKSLLVILSHTNICFALDLSPVRHFPPRYLYGYALSLHSNLYSSITIFERTSLITITCKGFPVILYCFTLVSFSSCYLSYINYLFIW